MSPDVEPIVELLVPGDTANALSDLVTLCTDCEKLLNDESVVGATISPSKSARQGCQAAITTTSRGVLGTVEQTIHVGQQNTEFIATVAGQSAHTETSTSI